MPGLDPHWQAVVERSIQEFLVWVGFGTIVGLTAKAIMPGKDPGGAVATLLMGIVGSVIGCGSLAFFIPNAKSMHDSKVARVSSCQKTRLNSFEGMGGFH